MGRVLTLHVVRTGRRVAAYRFESTRDQLIRLGRGQGCAVRVDDPAACRLHAAIELSRGRVLLRDLGTTTGTFVDGERIMSADLHDGAVIGIGECIIEVAVEVGPELELPSEAPKGPAAVAGPAVDLRGLPAESVALVASYVEQLRVQAATPVFNRPAIYASTAAFAPGVSARPVQAPRAPEPAGDDSDVAEVRFDTQRLLLQMRRDRRRSQLGVAAAAALVATAVGLPLADLDWSPPRASAGVPTAPRVTAGAPQAPAEPAFEPVSEPEAPPAPPAASPPVPPSPPTPPPRVTYSVVAGDTLARIAAAMLGDATRWPAIMEANAGLLPRPEALEVGMELVIPIDGEAAP